MVAPEGSIDRTIMDAGQLATISHRSRREGRSAGKTPRDEFHGSGRDPRASRPYVNGLGAWGHRQNVCDLRKNSIAPAR